MSLLSINWNLTISSAKLNYQQRQRLVISKNHVFVLMFLKSSTTVLSFEALRCYMLKLIGRRFATDDIRLTGPIIFLSMSSSDLPCVSGTQVIWKAKKFLVASVSKMLFDILPQRSNQRHRRIRRTRKRHDFQ